MNINKNNTIVINRVFEETTPEVDFEMYNDILGQDNVNVAYEEDGINFIDKEQFYENRPMSIEYLKKFIAKAESNGCNYVAIDYNCDHPDYTLHGIEIHSATDMEVDAEVKRIEEEKKKRVEKELERLDNERRRLLNSIK